GDDLPVYAVAFAADGRAWAGRAGDLLRSDDQGQSWQVVATLPPTVTVLSLAPLPDGQVAIGSGGAGILRFGPDGLRVISATHQFVSAIAADSAGRIVARVEGQVWRGGVSAPWQRVDLPVTMAVASGPTGFLAATEREGVWQSVDGVTWRPVGGAIRGTVYAVASGRSLWAATNQAALRLDGQRWTPIAAGYGRPLVRSLAAGYGALFAATADGVYRRDADGWRPVGRDLADTLTLAVLPIGPSTIVAGTWERGVMKTDDGGRSWEAVTEFEYSRAIIPALAADGATLVARVEYARVLRSVDGGDSWTLADRGMLTRTVFSVSAYGGQFFAGTDAGVYRWVDGEWRPLPGQPADGVVTALLATPTGPVAGTVDGLWRATATGWERTGLRGRHVVSILPGPDGAALAVATADDGAFVRRDGAWRRLGPPDVRLNSIAIDPRDDSLVAAAETGVFRLRGWR
ncbi:MAG: hypothetical protein NZ518_07030, partial [Dehalococcoidia bacterium]|nr:hypothetical protein [Dehalococcoidia bacterium]